MKLLLFLLLLIPWTAEASEPVWNHLTSCKAPPFEEGEMARFVTKVGIIRAGEGTVILRKEALPPPEIPLSEELPEQDVWHVAGRIVSIPPVSIFYRVDDTMSIWMEQGSLVPHRQEMSVDETNERGTRRVLFDHAGEVSHYVRDRKYYRKNRDKEKITTREDQLDPGSLEPISLLFHLRCIDAEKGSRFEFPVHENGKNRRVKVEIEEVEEIKTPLGRKEALRARVEVFFEDKLANKRPFLVWISNDEERLPLRYVADLKFANLKGILAGYRRNYEADIEGELDPDFVEQLIAN